MLLEHRGKRPKVHELAYVAPTATICGDVTMGENSRVLFGAVVTAEGGPVEIGAECIVMENAVIRAQGVEHGPVEEVLQRIVRAIVARPAGNAQQVAALIEIAREELLTGPRLGVQKLALQQRPVWRSNGSVDNYNDCP